MRSSTKRLPRAASYQYCSGEDVRTPTLSTAYRLLTLDTTICVDTLRALLVFINSNREEDTEVYVTTESDPYPVIGIVIVAIDAF